MGGRVGVQLVNLVAVVVNLEGSLGREELLLHSHDDYISIKASHVC